MHVSNLWFKLPLRHAGARSGGPENVSLRYDAWRRESRIISEGKHTGLPARFRFGTGGLQAVTLRPHGPVRLSCSVGTLWITRERDPLDYVLSAGDSIQLRGSGTLAVMALPHGLLQVEPSD